MRTLDILKNIIDKHEIIFFDIFDTLIKRTIPREKDLFYLVDAEFKKRYKKEINFYRNRQLAEKLARKNCKYREVNLDEIYIYLNEFYDKNTIEILKLLEVKLELDLCIRNNTIVKYYDYCVNNKKRIFIISDMYLNRNVIEEILRKNNIIKYERLYISCEERITKWENGALFKKVIEENNLNLSDIVHIGNDKIADFKMAKKQGIEAFLVKEKSSKRYFNDKNFSKKDKFVYRCLGKFIDNTLDGKLPNSYKIGYEVFGPILYEYIKWLSIQTNKLHLEKIYFISRDGYVLKKAFDILNKNIESYYFYASRRAIIIPSFIFCNTFEEIIDSYKSWPHTFSLKFLFNKLGLNCNFYKEEILKYGLNENSIFLFKDIKDNNVIRNLYEDIKEKIKNNSRKQYDLLKKYIDENNMSGKVGIVDIGAGCSIEYAFNKIINKSKWNIDLYGLYFHTYRDFTEHRKAFIDSSKENENFNVLLRFCYMLLEVFLSAPHGTVLEYKEKNNIILPVCDEYEYNNKDGIINEELEVKNLQQGALDFIKNVDKSIGKYISFNEDIILSNFKNFGLTPNLEDAVLWGNFRFSSDEFKSLAKPKNVGYYLIKPAQFFEDLRESLWPAAFLERVFKFKLLNKSIFYLYKVYKTLK